MATIIKSFVDLQVWQKVRELANLIYDLTSKFPKEERFNLVDQLRRAVISVMANIAEGFSRYYQAETVMFYRNARGSLAEVKSLIYISFDRRYIGKSDFEKIILRLDEIGKMLNGLIKSTRNFRRSKF